MKAKAIYKIKLAENTIIEAGDEFECLPEHGLVEGEHYEVVEDKKSAAKPKTGE